MREYDLYSVPGEYGYKTEIGKPYIVKTTPRQSSHSILVVILNKCLTVSKNLPIGMKVKSNTYIGRGGM